MRIGIYIPNRNDSAVLRRALQCATTQGADDVVVVDDASNDDSVRVVREFPGVRLVEHPSKTPDHIEALAPIVSEMPVDYCIGMGADDVLMPGVVDAIRQEAERSRPGVVFTDYAIISDSGESIGVRSSGFDRVTFLDPAEATFRLASTGFGLFECGVGSAVSMDAHKWQVRCGAWRMGPWGDSVGNSVTACVFGASYVPVLGAGFTVSSDGTNWHTVVHGDEALASKYRKAIMDFMCHEEVKARVSPETLSAIAIRWGA